ncbi:MAG TPA: hypothetical protein VHX90_06205 [Verrucomicrobiae bacterium]|nr:hypothetical protein [Verrucomicrobiae bacterium]
MPFSDTQIAGAEAARDDGWLTPRRFAALLAVFVLASWPQVFFGLQTFVFRDFGYYSYPAAFHLRESFWRGEIPLWNPLSYCGSPFLAQWNTQALYPPALFYLVFPLSWSLAVFCLLHLYLGGMGMFFLARRWTGNNPAAAMAGIAFAFGGVTVNSLMWPCIISGLGWMPWVVWLVERAWREGGRLAVVAAIAGALQMLSGAVEAILMTWVLIGALGLMDFISGGFPRGKMILRGVFVVALVTGLCAVQILPFFQLLQHSQRQDNFDAAIWPMPLTGWANFLVPLFHAQQSFHSVFVQPNQDWTYSYYVGVFTVALAALAPWRVRSGRVWVLTALTLFFLVLAFGDATPVYTWCRQHIGFVKLMRFPVKFVILPVFTLPLLAAFTLAAKTDPARRQKEWLAVWFAVVVLMLDIFWWSLKFPDAGDDQLAILENGAMRGLFFTAIGGAWLFAGKLSKLRPRRLLQLLVFVLMWLDISYHASQPPTVNRPVYEPFMARALPAPSFGQSRAMVSHKGAGELRNSYVPDVAGTYLSKRAGLFSNCNLLDDIPKVDGFFPLQLSEQSQIQLLLYSVDSPDTVPAPFLDFIGASQITSETNIFKWTPRTGFMPMITGGQKPVFTGDDEAFWGLFKTNFNPRAEVYLSPEDRALVPDINSANVKISDTHFAAQHIEAKVDADAPSLVVIAQTFYEPWRAYIDGRPAKVMRANYAFQAVAIPAGRHGLKLAYEDRRFYCGAVVSLATLLACALSWLGFSKGKSADANQAAPAVDV